jgi:transcriptional regulator with XRE-family HTH domain
MPRKPAPRGPQPADAYVGARIRLRRSLIRISQADLAALLGITSQQVQKYERGANRIGASRLLQICEALDVTPAWLFEGAPGAKSRPSAAGRDIDSAISAFHADRLAPELIQTFLRVPFPIRRAMVTLMAMVADRADGSK